jgi:hypothetical protein
MTIQLMQNEITGSGHFSRRVNIFYTQQPLTIAMASIDKTCDCADKRAKMKRACGGWSKATNTFE